ncbi:hypothetical protein [Acinetobacter venetianus]|uniref:hypothetical protein n=1 Tax=Acinetobacter venetianus TaxID=52133 RepID=UPI00241EA697|nr:hypothetical protein [Acinetobacter venetianus]
MNSAAELKRHNEMNSLQKSKDRVIEALNKDPFGLRIEQIMSICRISAKTAKNVLACLETENNEGVYTLKNMAKPNVDVTIPEHKVKITDNKSAPAPAPAILSRRDIQGELLKLLEEFNDGLSSSEIITKLNINEKQFSNALWTLRKIHNIQRSGKVGTYTYCLLNSKSNETESDINSNIASNSNVINKEPVDSSECSENKHLDPDDPLNVFKSKISTKVTRLSELKIDADQLSDLMAKLFGLSNVEWFVDAGRLVGVYLSEEITS